jgi:hypothetical protein
MRVITTLICLLSLVLTRPVGGMSNDEEVRSSFQAGGSIQISSGDWGEARVADIQTVLESAAGELTRYFPNTRLNIKIIQGGPNPRVFCQKGPSGEYIVRLNVKGRVWDQFSYQFAHELFHVLSNYERDCNDNDRSPNQWFEETLGEVASMFVLGKMATTWRANPPYEHWKDYAPALGAYGQRLIEQPHRQLPNGKTFVQWFTENRTLLRGDPYLRDKNGLIANRLLPLFERNPESWESVSYLNLGDRDATNSFQSYLDNWYGKVPARHKGFVANVANTFGMRITGS